MDWTKKIDLGINLGLLSLGFLGAMIAFGGDTWLKADVPIYRRITSRGWIAIVCLLLALSLGIWKEFRADQAAEASAVERDRLKSELKKFEETRKTLSSLEPNVLEAMYSLTERVVREADFAFVRLGGIESTPISSETNSPLKLYGGDEFEYSLFCDGRLGGSGEIALVVGGREYPLTSSHGTLRIAGPIGVAMNAQIRNPQRLPNCDVKIIVRSTDRARMRAQFASLLKSIEEAKAAERNQ